MKRLFQLLPVIILFVLCVNSNCFAEDRSDLIRKYIDKSGTMNSLVKIWDAQSDMAANKIIKKNPLSKRFKADFKKVWIDVMQYDFWASGGLFDMMKPMFDDFTEDELKKVIAFYESPVGMKMANIANGIDTYLSASTMKQYEMRIIRFIVPEVLGRLEVMGWDENGKRIK